MGKIAINLELPQEHLDRIQKAVPEWEVVCRHESSDWLSHLKEAEIVLSWDATVEQAIQESGAAIRWVHAWGAGVNGLPMDLFQTRGIMLTNSSGVHANPISETILAMMLSFRRLLHVYMRHQLQQKWEHSDVPKEMHGETVGIIGVGDIGIETARLAKAFGMRVLGVRRSGEPAEYVDRMYRLEGLPLVLNESDYVVNTLPLTEETHHYIGAEQFAQMKPNTFYINIGRGQTTDSKALLQALQDRTIAGAGLDVFEQEPLPADDPLWQMDNVIITPHSSGHTQYYGQRALEIFLGNLHDYITQGEPTRNRVDLLKQY